MTVLGAALSRLLSIGTVPACKRCGRPLEVVGETRVSTVPPAYDLACRCSGCGASIRVRQVLAHFE